MIDYETYCRIRLLAEKGLKASQIAAELQLDIKTVEKYGAGKLSAAAKSEALQQA